MSGNIWELTGSLWGNLMQTCERLPVCAWRVKAGKRFRQRTSRPGVERRAFNFAANCVRVECPVLHNQRVFGLLLDGARDALGVSEPKSVRRTSRSSVFCRRAARAVSCVGSNVDQRSPRPMSGAPCATGNESEREPERLRLVVVDGVELERRRLPKREPRGPQGARHCGEDHEHNRHQHGMRQRRA